MKVFLIMMTFKIIASAEENTILQEVFIKSLVNVSQKMSARKCQNKTKTLWRSHKVNEKRLEASGLMFRTSFHNGYKLSQFVQALTMTV